MSLQSILDEAIGDPPRAAVDVDQIIRRQRRCLRARRRAVAGGAVLVVLAASAAAAVALGPGRGQAPPPAAQESYFPGYTAGTRIIAQTSAPLSRSRLELTFIPSVPQYELTLFVWCDAGGSGATFDMVVTVGAGAWTMNDFCGENSVRPSPGWAPFAEVGQPSTISLTVSGAAASAPLAQGTFGLAVGEPVAYGQYPLPIRPQVLPPLDATLSTVEGWHRAAQIRADPSDPTKPMSATVRWAQGLIVNGRAQTPGYLHVEVNGVRVKPVPDTLAVWDYEQSEVGRSLAGDLVAQDWPAGTPPAPGDEVTITVVPEHITGDWIVWLHAPD